MPRTAEYALSVADLHLLLKTLQSAGQQHVHDVTGGRLTHAWDAGPCPQQLKCPLSAQNLAYIKMAIRSARTSMDADDGECLLYQDIEQVDYLADPLACLKRSIWWRTCLRCFLSTVSNWLRNPWNGRIVCSWTARDQSLGSAVSHGCGHQVKGIM